jgi:hypothetical protein
VNGINRSSYWLIIRDDGDRMEVLTVWLTDHGEALPVFSFEEDATSFCERRGLGSSWHGRETSIEELALVLCGLCADVERIALDPLPQTDAEMLVALTYIRCEDFLTFLFRENTSHVGTADTQGLARATISRARSNG